MKKAEAFEEYVKEDKSNLNWCIVFLIIGLAVGAVTTYSLIQQEQKVYEPGEKYLYWNNETDHMALCYVFRFQVNDTYHAFAAETACYKTQKGELKV